MTFRKKLLASVAGTLFSLNGFAAIIDTDVVVLMDESSSMNGEQAWIGGMITSLESELAAKSLTADFGLVGYGSGTVDSRTLMDGGNAAAFNTADDNLLLNGGTEDGYDAMDHVIGITSGTGTGQANSGSYTLNSGAVTNMILVTDEDRDTYNTSLNYTNVLSALNNTNALLNAVINVSITCNGSAALGVDSNNNYYVADGQGGYSICRGEGSVSSNTSWTDYGLMALATGGAAWNLNQLRVGGLTADSFTAAFVAIKVKETEENVPNERIPVPAPLALIGLGLIAAGFSARKKSA